MKQIFKDSLLCLRILAEVYRKQGAKRALESGYNLEAFCLSGGLPDYEHDEALARDLAAKVGLKFMNYSNYRELCEDALKAVKIG